MNISTAEMYFVQNPFHQFETFDFWKLVQI